ncbi:hypothetical protein JCM8097_006235 [Rhodosporidiobolus ruineniae]
MTRDSLTGLTAVSALEPTREGAEAEGGNATTVTSTHGADAANDTTTNSPLPSSSTRALPTELLDRIFSCHKLDKRDLAHCCQVSRRFRALLLPKIYGTIHIWVVKHGEYMDDCATYDPDQRRFVAAVLSNPELAAQVRDLRCSARTEWWEVHGRPDPVEEAEKWDKWRAYAGLEKKGIPFYEDDDREEAFRQLYSAGYETPAHLLALLLRQLPNLQRAALRIGENGGDLDFLWEVAGKLKHLQHFRLAASPSEEDSSTCSFRLKTGSFRALRRLDLKVTDHHPYLDDPDDDELEELRAQCQRRGVEFRAVDAHDWSEGEALEEDSEGDGEEEEEDEEVAWDDEEEDKDYDSSF